MRPIVHRIERADAVAVLADAGDEARINSADQ